MSTRAADAPDPAVSADVVRAVDRALAARYGEQVWPGPGDPLSGLIGTILSQNTTAANSRAAFASLVSTHPTWDEVADAPEEAIAQAIRCGGLGDRKAATIRSILRGLRARTGALSLDFLSELGDQAAFSYLAALEGVGPKTAACVLMFDLGRQVFPVDTHVLRICKRLGWVRETTSAERAHAHLARVVPGQCAYQLHVNMVRHGRGLCRPRGPRCDQCPVTPWCRAFPITCDLPEGHSPDSAE